MPYKNLAEGRAAEARRQAARLAAGDLCAEQGCARARQSRGLCKSHYKRKYPSNQYRNTERYKAQQRAKTHRRRTVGRYTDITLEYEQDLRRKARRCLLCLVRLTNRPYLPHSKELDHMIPLNVGGTHTIGNVRVICRDCNLSRPKDGSDYSGQVTLWAAEPGFTMPPPKRRGRKCEHGITVSYVRCYICKPLRRKSREVDGQRAAVLRAEGWAWKDIALATGYANTGACYGAAQAHGLPEVVARWPARYINVGTKPAPELPEILVALAGVLHDLDEVAPVPQPAQPSLPTAIARAAPAPPPPLVCVDCTDPVARGSIRCSECLVEIEESYTQSHKSELHAVT